MNPREEHETLIRLDENVKVVLVSLERGILKFDRIDERLNDLELTSAKHEKLMSEHPGICSELAELKDQITEHKSFGKGKAKGTSNIITIITNIVSMTALILSILVILKVV